MHKYKHSLLSHVIRVSLFTYSAIHTLKELFGIYSGLLTLNYHELDPNSSF